MTGKRFFTLFVPTVIVIVLGVVVLVGAGTFDYYVYLPAIRVVDDAPVEPTATPIVTPSSTPSATPSPTPSPTPTDTPAAETMTRVSVATDGAEGNGDSYGPSISADGRYVAFESAASNVVADDTNDEVDVFVHDLVTSVTTRVSVSSGGTESDSQSDRAVISANGRFVAFLSLASNLVANDTNLAQDVFVHDLQTGETMRISVSSGGVEGDGSSYQPTISADGRYVAFFSEATNLVADDTNETSDVFVHDRQTGETTRVSVADDGTEGNDGSYVPSITADGRLVAFGSFASNLVDDDSNDIYDVFVHDRQTGETILVSVASNGTQGNGPSYIPDISADGHFVTFYGDASNLVADDTNEAEDIFVHDLQTSVTTRVSLSSEGVEADGTSYLPVISGEGRYVAYVSTATNLVSSDNNAATDVFFHDRQTGETTLVSVSGEGVQGNGGSSRPAFSTEGRYVAFDSVASNLVADDTNEASDIFVYDRAPD